MSLSKITLQKQPGETRLFSMDFSNKMVSNEAIVSIDNISQILANGDATTDLVFTNQSFSAQVVQFLIAGGEIPARKDINECDYKVTVTVTTDAGQVLENDGILKIKED